MVQPIAHQRWEVAQYGKICAYSFIKSRKVGQIGIFGKILLYNIFNNIFASRIASAASGQSVEIRSAS
jgi:hypothetical protein